MFIANARGQYYVLLDDDVPPDDNLIIAYDEGFSTRECRAIQGRVELLFALDVTVPKWLSSRFRLDLAEMDFGQVVEPFTMAFRAVCIFSN